MTIHMAAPCFRSTAKHMANPRLRTASNYFTQNHGRHAWKELFFQGDLAELFIYNKGLSPRELSDTTAYLADKYSIPLDRGGKE